MKYEALIQHEFVSDDLMTTLSEPALSDSVISEHTSVDILDFRETYGQGATEISQMIIVGHFRVSQPSLMSKEFLKKVVTEI
jgi:hypothetical protein